jgi:hypothetical protein
LKLLKLADGAPIANAVPIKTVQYSVTQYSHSHAGTYTPQRSARF